MPTNEPRALTAALSAPAFVTKGGGMAMHTAHRHAERWAPESSSHQVRPLKNLGFVDRLLSPWLESAQRSPSVRMFSQYISSGVSERPAAPGVSWVFPRPWYQDELDWMAAARTQAQAQAQAAQQAAPTMLTTRGTYVPPAQAALPSALYEYVAPSLSVARPPVDEAFDAYSPLVPFAATQAAEVMARAIAPLMAPGAQAVAPAVRMSPGLRAVLSTMLERSTRDEATAPTRASLAAPELVTPPAPRMPELAGATEVAERYAAQHAQLAEIQRVARAAEQQREVVREAPRAAAAPSETRADRMAREAEIQQRITEATSRRDVEVARRDAERQRIEERIAERLAERTEGQRLHEQAREAAIRDARSATVEMPSAPSVVETRQHEVAAAISAAVSALPPELAAVVSSSIGQRPDRAAQAITEISHALRAVELMARTTATGGAIEATRGPRLVMPAGLGGLVSTVQRTTERPQIAAPARRMPAMPWLAAQEHGAAPTTALGAATQAMPAALQHIAWSDRWLARFAGARPAALDALSVAAAAPHARMQMLAEAAPESVFVAPFFDASATKGEQPAVVATPDAVPLPTLRGGVRPEQSVMRFDDDAETPDDVLAAISMAASRTRSAAAAPVAAPSAPYQPRETLADLIAQGAPVAPGAGLAAQLASSPFAPALHHLVPSGAAPMFDVRALFGEGIGATYLAGLVGASADEIEVPSLTVDSMRDYAQWEPTYVAPGEAPVTVGDDGEGTVEQLRAYQAPLTTLRSTLLSWDVETLASTPGAVESRVSSPSAMDVPLARTLLDSLTLPLAPAVDEAPAAYTAPGMIGDRAHAFSIAQQRSVSDLAFDFVTPELVLAARVYGLGPAEAAQAMRLAIAGPGHLSAMANTVDRTFVQAMAIDSERRGRAISTAYPAGSEAAGDARAIASDQARSRWSSFGATDIGMFSPSKSAFGVERRAPRGAFLWPAATTAALGMQAAAPEGEQAISVAALELLAAQAVAELGTYTALGALPGEPSASGEARDEDVFESTAAFMPSARRDKFQALYVALGQSASGRALSPAARAARALALAGRGEESISARERASIAWDVLPLVQGIDDDDAADAAQSRAPLSTGEAAQRAVRQREQLTELFVDARPGLGRLSARAGEALGFFVAPPAEPREAREQPSRRDAGAVLRAPTAAPELVQTGGYQRYGGGEVEIPAWFEAAAKKMFDSQSASVSEGISLAELTLVESARPTQIAASSRGVGSGSASSQPAAATDGGTRNTVDGPKIDIEKLAGEVYSEILAMMDAVRARNGEPH